MDWDLSALEDKVTKLQTETTRRKGCATAKSPLDLMPSVFDCWLWKASGSCMEPLASLPPQNCEAIFVISCFAWPCC